MSCLGAIDKILKILNNSNNVSISWFIISSKIIMKKTSQMSKSIAKREDSFVTPQPRLQIIKNFHHKSEIGQTSKLLIAHPSGKYTQATIESDYIMRLSCGQRDKKERNAGHKSYDFFVNAILQLTFFANQDIS